MSPFLPRVILAVLVFIPPAQLTAQVSPEAAVHRLEPGSFVRVHTDGRRVEGRFSGTTIAPPGLELSESTIEFPKIDSLWVRGNAARGGAITGAVVIGLSSAILLAVYCTAVSDGTGCDEYGKIALVSLAGAGGGALLGAAIGSAVPRWHLRYARFQVGLQLSPYPQHRSRATLAFQLRPGIF